LPLANDEAAALRRSMSQVIEVCGSRLDATGALAAMKQATHLHVACHGEYDANDASRSGLLLAHGERLTLTRLWAAGFERFAMRLVFLSCCEGGMTGRSLDSDEFAGLPAAFLQLGANGVIAAQWAVHDDAARVFADAFYRRYLDADGVPRTTPTRALGETRRWMRSVTVATLIDENYLLREKAEELFDWGRAMVGGGASARESILETRPYAPACHWAGWTLFGR
jgi:CHAT domain-containing protein